MTEEFAPEISPKHALPLKSFAAGRLVAFDARRVPSSKIVWLNVRWFLSAGIDVTTDLHRSTVISWLLHTFGVSVPYPPKDPLVDYSQETVTLYADRYGGVGGATHGGSGRCGAFGQFNAKGVGRTPLVSDGADWYHSHGCMWLEEAIREAIASEVVIRETPHGGIPVIAVIALGTRVYRADGTTGALRGVVVRPNFYRLAHLQRSIFFGTSGAPGSDQVQEANAVRADASLLWATFNQTVDRPIRSKSLLDSALNIGSQIAFCRFHRLWLGPFYASNATFDGASVDYGSFRAVPGWRRFHGDVSAPGFGDEIKPLTASILSICLPIARVGTKVPDAAKIFTALASRMRRVFATECLKALHLSRKSDHTAAADAVAVLVDHYEKEQNISEGPTSTQETLGDVLLEHKQVRKNDSDVYHVSRRLKKTLMHCHRNSRRAYADYIISLMGLHRVMSRRPLIQREQLLSRTIRLVRKFDEAEFDFEGSLQRFIENTLSRSRRVWPDLPEKLIVLGQRILSDGAYALCFDAEENRFCVWLEALRVSESVFFAGKHFDRNSIAEIDISSTCELARYSVIIDDQINWRWKLDDISFGGAFLNLPRMLWRYSEAYKKVFFDLLGFSKGSPPSRPTETS